MADNFVVNGVTVGSDDCAGVQIQRIKLIDGTADSTTGLPGDAANGLDVDVTRSALPALAATSTKQSDGTQKTQVVDGAGAVIGSTANALDVNIKSGAGSGGTALTDEATFTPATTSFTPAGGIFNTTPDTLATGKGGAFAMTGARGQHAHVVDAAGATVSLTTSTLTGAVTETAPASDTASSGLNGRLQRIAQRLTSMIALLPAALSGSGNLKVAIMEGGGTGGTAIADEATFTPATTSFTPTGGIFNTTPDTLTTGKGGAFAMTTARGQHVCPVDTAGAPMVVGGRIDVNIGAVAGVATTADTAWKYAAPAGGLVSITGVTAKAAAGAGVRNYVTGAQITNSHQTISSEIVIRDGAAGTVLHRTWAQFAGGGGAYVFDPPLFGTANTLIEIGEISTTSTAGVLVNLQGFSAA